MATTGLSTAVPHTPPLEQTRDAAPPRSSAETGMRCPDPSAHSHQTKSNALQNQASAAALYSTNAAKTNEKRGINPLGPDGKLSSASAATSLKYAKAKDLPSFPVVGIDTQSSAGAAAVLANQNKKSPEWWKPEQSAAAGKAALLANDYKMKPMWQPEASAAGSKAAILAHRDASKLNLWTPEPSADGSSAANIAMRKQGLSPQVDYGHTGDGRRRALIAAMGAHSASGRKRAQSNPAPTPLYPDEKNSAKNALSAATMAHSPSMRAARPTPSNDSNRLGNGAMEAARIQHAKSISRDMYTSAPPVAIEVEERQRNDALRASAISMAKKMYDVQQHPNDGASGRSAAQTGATTAHGQRPFTTDADIKKQAMQYIGIQEAAQKLAQERLAKIGYDETAAYRSYYGYEKSNRSKLTMRRGRTRARSTSAAPAVDSDSDEDDFRSRRIRSQMDHFNKQLADVDARKRESDRKGLLAAAERKVHAQMQGLDKKIFDETGKMSSAMMDDWDDKARQRALANSEARMENHGRVNIGNGKWMDQSDIDAIAQARIQPTLDEITEKTTKRRAEEEERRLELEEQKRQERTEKERAAEIKAEERKGRDEEKRTSKARVAEEKAMAKQEKEAERTRKAEEQRLVKEEKRKSKEVPRGHAGVDNAPVNENDDLYGEPTPAGHVLKDSEHTTADLTSPTSPSSSKGFKSIFSKLKRRSKHDSVGTTEIDSRSGGKDTGAFIGGAALTSGSQSHSSTAASQPQAEATQVARPTDLSDVEPRTVPHLDELDEDRYSDISSLSNDNGMARGRSVQRVTSNGTSSTGSEFEEAKDHFDANLAPPPTFTSDGDKGRVGSPVRDSKFREVGI